MNDQALAAVEGGQASADVDARRDGASNQTGG